jgi:hypothetical protein
MEILIALGMAVGLAAAALAGGADSRPQDLDRPRRWWPGRRPA